jgi:O-antigen ligase
MTDRFTPLSWVVVCCVAFSALVPDIGFHSPVGSDDCLPLIATCLAAFILMMRPLSDPGPMVMVLMALFALGILANIFIPDFFLMKALLRGPARVGMYLVFVLGYASVVENLDARKVLSLCCLCALLEAVFGLSSFFLNYSGPWHVGVYFTEEPTQSLAGSGYGRIVGTFNTSNGQGMNFASAYLMMFVPILFALGKTAEGWARQGWFLASLIVAGAMLATYTRMSIVALLGGLIVALAILGRLKLIGSVVAAGALGILMTPGLAQRFLDKNDRIKLYAASIEAAMDSPWLGHGDTAYLEYIFANSNRYHTMFGVAGSTPHNSILYAFFRYGIGGALLTALLLAVPILYFAVQVRRQTGKARILALAGVATFVSFALQSQTNNLLDIPKVTFYFFALWVGLRMVVIQASQQEAGKLS